MAVFFCLATLGSRAGCVYIKTYMNRQMLFTAVTHLGEGLSFETLLTLKVEKPLICVVCAQGPRVSFRELQLFISLTAAAAAAAAATTTTTTTTTTTDNNNNNNQTGCTLWSVKQKKKARGCTGGEQNT
jgi:hypothetical protein